MTTGREAEVAPAAVRQARSSPAASPAGASATRADMVGAHGISRAFGATQALRECSIDVRPGEVHVLMGENGSGKSTLVKILSGVHRPDTGTITLAGVERPPLSSPRQAIASGIATVFQEILVVRQQSVLANVWLGGDGVARRSRGRQERRTRAQDVIGQLIDPPDLDAVIEGVNLNDRQAICIARALLSEPRVLILDEATSALDVTTRDNLFAVLRDLRSRGVAVLMISHRMDEVEEMADRITVFRSGEKVGTVGRGQATTRALVEMMTGVDHAPPAPRSAGAAGLQRPLAIRAAGVTLAAGASPIDAEFRSGEIVGLAGLEGHGQDVFLQALAGAQLGPGEVLCAVDGNERTIRSRAEARALGIAYVPRDRRDESLLETRSILDNFSIASSRSDRRAGLIHRRSLNERFEGYVDRLKITAGRRTDAITSLSGGNQQKVIIARWMARHPRVMLLNDPTRGVDMGAKLDIYKILRDAAADGVAVVMVSTELIELVELTDRVLVFRESEVFRELTHDEITRTRLVTSYFGKDDE